MCSGRLGSCYSRGLSFFRNEGVRCIKGKPCPAQVSASALTLCTDSVSDSRAFRPTRCCALPSPSPPAPTPALFCRAGATLFLRNLRLNPLRRSPEEMLPRFRA